jgi:hypothetical protein
MIVRYVKNACKGRKVMIIHKDVKSKKISETNLVPILRRIRERRRKSEKTIILGDNER